MEKNKHIILENLFTQLANDHFGGNGSLVPVSLWKQQRMEELKEEIETAEPYDTAKRYHFTSNVQEKRREQIFNDERHSIDTSTETLDLLNLIIYNIEYLEQGTISVHGVIILGEYLRQQGDRVDFVKFDRWTKTLFIRRALSLLSSLLIDPFHFELSELPYTFSYDKKAVLRLYEQYDSTLHTGKMSRNATLMRDSPLAAVSNLRDRLAVIFHVEE